MPDGAPRPALSRCPECGTPAGAAAAPAPQRGLRLLRIAPFVMLLLALGSMTWMFIDGTLTVPMPPPTRGFVIFPTSTSATYVNPPFTVADLRHIADCEASARTDLIPAILARSTKWLVTPPGKDVLNVCIADRSGSRYEWRGWGWPLETVWYTCSADYLDALAPAHPSPPARPAIPTLRGSGTLQDPLVDFRSGQLTLRLGDGPERRNMSLSLPALATSFCVVLAMWYVFGAIGLLLDRRYPRSGRSWRRQLQVLAAAVMSLAIVVLSIAHPAGDPPVAAVTSTATMFGAGNRPPPNAVRTTTLDRASLEELGRAPDGASHVARQILGPYAYPADSVLAVAFVPETGRASELLMVRGVSLPLFTWERVQRWYEDDTFRIASVGDVRVSQLSNDAQADAAALSLSILSQGPTWRSLPNPPRPAVWPAASAALRYQSNQIMFSPARPAPCSELTLFFINPSTIGACLFLLWLAWFTAAFVCNRIIRSIARRRARNDLCIKCGYPLT